MKPLGGIRSVIKSYASWTEQEIEAVFIANTPFFEVRIPENFVVDKILAHSSGQVTLSSYLTANAGYRVTGGADLPTYYASANSLLLNGAWASSVVRTGGDIRPITGGKSGTADTYVTFEATGTVTAGNPAGFELYAYIYGYTLE